MNRAVFCAVVASAASGSAFGAFASNLVDSNNADPFGSGIVTGAPTNDGYFFPNTSATDAFVTVSFAVPFVDGPGFDMEVYDAADGAVDLAEEADVFVSANNVDFFYAGTIVGGPAGTNLIDLSDNGLNGAYTYVKVMHTPIGSGDGIDLDAVETYYVPTPATLSALAGAGLLATRRRRG